MDLLKFALRELNRRRLRTLTNILGYTLAVAIMVMLVNAIVYSKQMADNILNSTGTHFIASVPANLPSCPQCSLKLSDNKDEGFVVYGVPTKLISVKFIDEVNKINAVKDASKCLLYRFRNDKGEISSIAGFDPTNDVAVSTTTCAKTDIISGSFLMPNDKGKVMLEEAYAKLKGLKSGDKLNVAKDQFVIVGIVNPGIRPAKADIYTHFDEAEQVINKRMGNFPIHNEANVILVETKSSKRQEEAMSSMKKLLPNLVFSSYACYRPAAAVMGINENSAYLLLIVIGISTIALALRSQLSSVIERRHDIGILKAIGWTDDDVVTQIFYESIIQALIGGLIGCVISPLILMLIPAKSIVSTATSSYISISPIIMLVGLALAVIGGIIAGVFPALSASRHRPADALRSI